jgi:hypothetical protein
MATKAHDANERHRVKAGRNREATGEMDLICECADWRCNATLGVTAAEYASGHRGTGGFWVRPGHTIPDLERVIEQHRDYAVVQTVTQAS